MKVATPKDMDNDLKQLEEVVIRFNINLLSKEKGLNTYLLQIPQEYNIELLNKVAEIFTYAGWTVDYCLPSKKHFIVSEKNKNSSYLKLLR